VLRVIVSLELSAMFQDKGWILVTLITLVTPSWAAYKLQERYSWSQLDFAFPNTRLKDQALASGDYIPQNALPVGVEHFGNRLFVTVPRWRDGKWKLNMKPLGRS